MKIGFVLDDGLDKPDGVQQTILTLGDWMKSQGHEIRYLVGETKRKDIGNVYSMSKNIKVRFNGNTLSIPLPASRKKIKNTLAQENFDVLHVQVPYSPFMGAKVIKHAHKRTAIVGTFHIMPYGWMSSFGTFLLGLVLHFNKKRFDFMASVSEPAAAFAKKSFRVNSQVVPNPVDLNYYRPSEKNKKSDERLKLLFVGRLVQRKGCMNLLKSLSILNKQKRLPIKWILDIAGDGVDRPELESYAKHAELQNNICFHGFISETKKVELMQNADISVFPSLSGESFGLVLIEAMAAGGGIVLGGNNPGYSSVLADMPESIITANNPSRIAAQLLEYIKRPQQRSELYKIQQEKIEKYDVSNVGTEYLQVYSTCKTE